MATWFAQNNSVNIDSVNQWNSAANGSGSWLTWASLAANDILVLNGKTGIIVNTNVLCTTITNYANGGTAGGSLVWSSGVTITANILAGGSNSIVMVTMSGAGTRTLIGNISSSGITNETTFITVTGSTLNVTGNITGPRGIGVTPGVSLLSGAIMTVVGQVWSFQIAGQIYQTTAITIASGCQCTVTGNIYGGPHSDSGQAIINAGTLFVTGDVYAYTGYASSAVQNSGTCEIIGDLYPSSVGPAYQQTSSGILYFTGKANTSSLGGFAFSNVTASNLRLRSTGNVEIALRAFTGITVGSERRLYSGGTNVGQPTAANVRSGTVFGAASEYTGTLAVPSPSLVAIGVATDNTVGSYNPSVNASDIRNAIGLASANLDTQLSGISNKTTNLPSDPADQSLVEAAITSAVSSISTLIDSLPTNAELATALAAADDAVLAAIAALNNLSAAQVNAELLDVLSVDTFGELSAPPAATSSLKDKITWLFMWAKNKATETATQRKLYADDNTTVVSTETVSDDGITFTKTKAS